MTTLPSLTSFFLCVCLFFFCPLAPHRGLERVSPSIHEGGLILNEDVGVARCLSSLASFSDLTASHVRPLGAIFDSPRFCMCLAQTFLAVGLLIIIDRHRSNYENTQHMRSRCCGCTVKQSLVGDRNTNGAIFHPFTALYFLSVLNCSGRSLAGLIVNAKIQIYR